MPVADRIRPATLNDVVGQSHLIGKNRPLTKIIESGRIPNMIFYGPSGVGKTTVARIIADSANMRLHKLNGTNASTADIKSVVSEVDTFLGCNGILLYLDEIQYLNKKQQQSLLEYIEDGSITLIASTTENPYFYVYNAILSRSTVFEFKPVQPAELEKAIRRGFSLMTEETGVEYHLDDEAVRYISRGCGGDVRKSLNTVELCALTCTDGEITLELAQELTQRSNMRYDRDGDQHYDLLSALQKLGRYTQFNAPRPYRRDNRPDSRPGARDKRGHRPQHRPPAGDTRGDSDRPGGAPAHAAGVQVHQPADPRRNRRPHELQLSADMPPARAGAPARKDDME